MSLNFFISERRVLNMCVLSKKFVGVLAAVFTSAGLTLGVGNSVFAQEAAPQAPAETHKDSEKALAPEHATIETPMCPSCKEVRVSPIKGKTLSSMMMVCPECKGETTEFAVHHCDKCGKDVLVCTLCNKAAAEGYSALMEESKCPKCKEVRTRPVKGRTLATWDMKCPDCKKKLSAWDIQHCDKCNIDYIACPLCKKEHEKK